MSEHLRRLKFDTLAQTDEIHIYTEYILSNGQKVLWEFDLVGDRLEKESQGRIPAQVHMECPVCTTQEDRTAISITPGNKQVEVEDLPPDKWRYWAIGPQGQVMELGRDMLRAKEAADHGLRVVINKVSLTVVEPIGCPYCAARFSITDNIIRKLQGGAHGSVIVCAG